MTERGHQTAAHSEPPPRASAVPGPPPTADGPHVIDIRPKPGSRAHNLAEAYRSKRIAIASKLMAAGQDGPVLDEDTFAMIMLADELVIEVLKSGA